MHPLQIIGCLITALTIVYLWVEVVGGFFVSRRRHRGAVRFVRDYQQLLDLPHEYAPIDPSHAKYYQLDAFDMARNELASEGFSHLADLENVTHSKVYKVRTFVRFLLSHDGQVLAFCHQDQIPGRREQAVFVDYISLFDNDEVLETGIDTGIDKRLQHSKWLTSYESMQTNEWQLLNIHRNRLRDHLHENAGVAVKTIKDLDGLLEVLRVRDHLLKEIVDQRDLMLEQLNAAGADPRFIDEVNRQRSA